jgi:hypothetical protein
VSPADVERVARVVGEEAMGAFAAGALDLRALRAAVRRKLRETAAEMGCGAGTAVDPRQTDWLAGAGVEGVVTK